jgi:hypothetical protein
MDESGQIVEDLRPLRDPNVTWVHSCRVGHLLTPGPVGFAKPRLSYGDNLLRRLAVPLEQLRLRSACSWLNERQEPSPMAG